MPDVLVNRIGGILDRKFRPYAAGCTTFAHADAAKTWVAPHGR
jgi:hypothetical protein